MERIRNVGVKPFYVPITHHWNYLNIWSLVDIKSRDGQTRFRRMFAWVPWGHWGRGRRGPGGGGEDGHSRSAHIRKYSLHLCSFLGVRIAEEASSSRRPSSTPSRSSMLKKSFRYRPNRRSTVIQFKQTFRSFRGKFYFAHMDTSPTILGSWPHWSWSLLPHIDWC